MVEIKSQTRTFQITEEGEEPILLHVIKTGFKDQYILITESPVYGVDQVHNKKTGSFNWSREDIEKTFKGINLDPVPLLADDMADLVLKGKTITFYPNNKDIGIRLDSHKIQVKCDQAEHLSISYAVTKEALENGALPSDQLMRFLLQELNKKLDDALVAQALEIRAKRTIKPYNRNDVN